LSCQYYINPRARCIKGEGDDFQKKAEQVISYHKSINGYHSTSLHSLANLALKTGLQSIHIKDESSRFGLKAFKALGASWAIRCLLNENPGTYTFCTATDGNHGRAVAWSARIMNQKAVVFIPETTVQSRIRSIEKEGAAVHIVKGDYDSCVEIAAQAASKNGYVLIQDTSWKGYEKIPALITEGYYTLIHEIIQKYDPGKSTIPFDIIFLQAGVGSWASSAVKYFCNQYQKEKPKFIIVEPNSADCVLESVRNGKISRTKGAQDTIMAGLNCGTPSMAAFDILRNTVDVFISISDDYARLALRILQDPLPGDPAIESCETGAAGLAGMLAVIFSRELSEVKKHLQLNHESRILLINTEGNTDPEMNAIIMTEKTILPWNSN
jgi:diaminopropionate ammonia-lyase